jgi:hypothetical protein
LGAALLLWGATFLHWYMVEQPAYAHASSACAGALALWLWDRGRGQRGAGGYLSLGLVLGLAMSLRWRNAVLLVLPALELIGRLHAERTGPAVLVRGTAFVGGGALAAGALLGALPQLPTCSRPCSRLAMGSCLGRRCCGQATSDSCRCYAGARVSPGHSCRPCS